MTKSNREKNITIHWFRQDLRLSDNPSLYEAAQEGDVLPIYILDNKNSGEHALGAASRWWLHYSLNALQKSLGGKLSLYQGNPQEILSSLIQRYPVKGVYWNRCYEPWRIKRDQKIKECLKLVGIKTANFNGSLLWEPWQIHKKDGTPYKVFTPYYKRGCLLAPPPRLPLAAPKNLDLVYDSAGSFLNELDLLPSIHWDKKMEAYWQMGEEKAQARLDIFLKNGLADYKEGRNFPAKKNVSRLSPHLHFGEISPHQVWYRAKKECSGENLDHFLSELGWREFSHSLLYYFPGLPRQNWQNKFDAFPWQNNREFLECWQKGQTGYPIVDAGMRELWQTGYIHNRVRMIVGSFLVKNLLLHWNHGERWFWDCLVDADLANNSASWQWVAGCGADAAPYFRVFNPITQGSKFDSSGEYTRCFVPELKRLPDKYLFRPWEAPLDVLKEAGVTLGKEYPRPIVDVKISREKALEAFASLKKANL